VIDHPCPFPEEIPDRLIKLYSHHGDLVLDPFAGSGQTLKVAKQLGRKYVGYETIAKYAQLARARIKGQSAIRPQQLIARFDKIAVDEPAGKKSEG
jgi:site-specific DNA-methyltransferase (adenine-specific)